MRQTFAIVHYNTPELTTCLCNSIKKMHGQDANIILFDNSDREPFVSASLFSNMTVLDNTEGTLLNFEKELEKYPNRDTSRQCREGGCRFGSFKHSLSIQYLMDRLDEKFILCDSDVIFTHPASELFELGEYACISDIMYAIRVSRIAPFCTLINPTLSRKLNISFLDPERMHGLRSNTCDIRFYYDTGASFLEDCMKANSFRRIHMNDYIVHYGRGSWANNNKAQIFTWLSKYYDSWSA